LCPEFGNFTISGSLGTNVWIYPNNPTLPANATDPTNNMTIVNPLYENNFVGTYMVSKFFDIDSYTQGNRTNPYKGRYDYQNNFMVSNKDRNPEKGSDTVNEIFETTVIDTKLSVIKSEVFNRYRLFDTTVFPFAASELFQQFNSVFHFGRPDKFIDNFAKDSVLADAAGVSVGLQIGMSNSVKLTTTTYSIDTLDILLGVIGGFTGLIWSIMSCCIGGYETFRQETEQLESFYSSDKNINSDHIQDQDNEKSNHSGQDTEADKDMHIKIKNEFDGRKEYEYLYCDHFIACWW